LELEREFFVFEEHLDQLLEKSEGKYVLIKGDDIVGTFPTSESAYETGLKRFGIKPFLVRQITKDESVGFVAVGFVD